MTRDFDISHNVSSKAFL